MVGVRVEDNVRALGRVDHIGAWFVEGGNVGHLADAVKNANNWVMPAPGAMASLLSAAADLVVAERVKIKDRKGAVVGRF